ncbi:15498_t:CDS:10, partial [Gigaspora rosea]
YGEPFSLYIFGSVITFTGIETSQDVLKNSDVFDFHAAIDKLFPINQILCRFKKFNSQEFLARAVYEQISGKISLYLPRIQKELLLGIEKYFGDCKKPKVFKNVSSILSGIIARPIASILFGEEAAEYEDLIESFSLAEKDLATLALNARCVRMLPLKFGWNPLFRHRDVFVKHFRSVIEERVRQRKELGKEYIQKEDLLDFYLSDPHFKTDVVDDQYMDELFGQMYSIVFASINTTSKALAFALFDYAGRPEIWNEIYEEQLKIHNESNGNINKDEVHKMVKLDCFIKESFRHSTDIAQLMHIMTGDSFTFSNGATIPKGRDVWVYMKDTAFSEKYFGKTANEFQPKRHLTLYSNGKTIHSPATKINKSFINFGGGKHACPGRFFAVSEIKVIFHKLILKYKIRTESGKIEPAIIISALSFPPNS